MQRRHKIFVTRVAAGMVLAILLAGCNEVVSGDAQTFSVNTGFIGEYAPGTREWLSWQQARDHCALDSKSPEIVDLRGPVAIYKCVTDK